MKIQVVVFWVLALCGDLIRIYVTETYNVYQNIRYRHIFLHTFLSWEVKQAY